MILRKTVLVLTVITLLLSLVLARKKQQGNAQMDWLVGELTQSHDEQPSLFDAFLRNQHRYFLENESQRQHLRKLYQDIQQSPDPAKLEKNMSRYYDWLQSMLQYQRMSHLSMTMDERIEQIRNSLAESPEEALPRFLSGPNRSPWNFEAPALKEIPNELFLTFYKNRLEEFFQELVEPLPEETKTLIENQKNKFSSLFGESPKSPGIWTLSTLLKLHDVGNAFNANMLLDTWLQDIHMESFRQMLPDEAAQQAFETLEPESKRFFVRRGILTGLFQQSLNNDFFKKLRSNRLTDAQEKLLREVFEFLPDREMEQIVKSPPEQFNREVVYFLLLPVNYRDRITGMRGMPGGGFGGPIGPGGPIGRPPGGEIMEPPPAPEGDDPRPRPNAPNTRRFERNPEGD